MGSSATAPSATTEGTVPTNGTSHTGETAQYFVEEPNGVHILSLFG